MKVELVGQAKRVFDGEVSPGPDWDELWVDTWATIEAIHQDYMESDRGGSLSGFVFQYVRDTSSADKAVKFSSSGTYATIHGEMVTAVHVRYHKIILRPVRSL